MKIRNRYILLISCGITHALLCLLCIGCANRGIGPQGGPIDSLPPVITKMTVENGALNVTEQKMSILFDEYIQLEGSPDNILVSPPQQRPPEIKAVGKRIDIAFQAPLQDSTTYTIDFGNQIVDNHESNPLPDYSFSFSTGNQIDSLEVYGQLINAEDLNPMSGVIIGLHAIQDDSAFSTIPFTRIGRTNEEGEFTIKNVKTGTYQIYALLDQSKDYCYQPGEGLAFMEQPITPYIRIQTEQDTIFLPDTVDANGHAIPDSIITAEYYYYEPSDIILKFFCEDLQRHYFNRTIRSTANRIQLFFNGSQEQVPTFTALRLESDSLMQDSSWVDFLEHSVLQTNPTLDTLTFWLTDSMAIQMDTIRFAMTYMKSDSAYNLVPQTDTIQCIYRAPRMSEHTRKALQQKEQKTGLNIQCNASMSFRHIDTLYLRSATPVSSFYKDSLHLQMKKDTLWKNVPFDMELADSSKTRFRILAAWRPGQMYQLQMDSGAIVDVYNKANRADKFTISMRPNEDYATLTVFLKPYQANAYIQLLNENDQPVCQLKAQEQGTVFQYMNPGIYYMRMFIDNNADGQWTTGSWKEHRQPEEVNYFRKRMNLRANWVFEETFDWQSTPLLEQKPTAIRKNGNATKK